MPERFARRLTVVVNLPVSINCKVGYMTGKFNGDRTDIKAASDHSSDGAS